MIDDHCQSRIICDDGPSRAGVNDFFATETDYGKVAMTSHLFPIAISAQRLGRVFDDEDSALPSEVTDFCHRRSVTEDVHRQDGFSVCGYLCAKRVRVQRERVCT